MAVNGLHAVQPLAVAQQLVVDAQHHFAAGPKRRGHQQIQRTADRTFGGIFQRYDGIIGLIGFSLPHTFVHRIAAHRVGGVAEMLDGRLLGKRAGRAEVGDGQRAFHRQAFAHHFAEQPRHAFVRKRAPVQFLNPPQHLRLAFGAVYRARPLQFADGARMDGAFVQQLQNRGIDFVYRIAVRQQLFFQLGGHGRSLFPVS